MRKIISQALTLVFLAISISAQTEKQTYELFDEFGRVNLEEIMSRIDSFISELSRRDETKAVFRIYGGSEDCFTCHYGRGSLITAYLKNTREISPDKYSIQYCTNSKENLRTQIYLLPKSEKLPDCEEALQIPQTAVFFDSVYFSFNQNSNLTALEDLHIAIGDAAHGDYSKSALKAINDLLEKHPDSRIYIIAYLGTNKVETIMNENGKSVRKIKRNLDKKSLARKMLLNARKELVKNGINSLRIDTVEGGYLDGKRELHFWFVPKGSEIPKPKPDYFQKKRQSKK